MNQSTKQFRKRNAILSCLQQTKSHPSAEMVYQMLQPEHPDISLATVYRNLALFKQQGMIVSIGTVDGVERFDYNKEPHAHFICERCGDVADIMGIDANAFGFTEAERELGCRVNSFSLTLNGVCARCRSNL